MPLVFPDDSGSQQPPNTPTPSNSPSFISPPPVPRSDIEEPRFTRWTRLIEKLLPSLEGSSRVRVKLQKDDTEIEAHAPGLVLIILVALLALVAMTMAVIYLLMSRGG